MLDETQKETLKNLMNIEFAAEHYLRILDSLVRGYGAAQMGQGFFSSMFSDLSEVTKNTKTCFRLARRLHRKDSEFNKSNLAQALMYLVRSLSKKDEKVVFVDTVSKALGFRDMTSADDAVDMIMFMGSDICRRRDRYRMFKMAGVDKLDIENYFSPHVYS